MLINELEVKKEILKTINNEIELKNPIDLGHNLKKYKHMTIGAITMLEELLNQ